MELPLSLWFYIEIYSCYYALLWSYGFIMVFIMVRYGFIMVLLFIMVY